MTEARLVQTKLRPPQLASMVIDRPRLWRRLEAHAGRVVLISAPAGFGKTVAVIDWLNRSGARSAWLSLDRFDNDFGHFRLHLAAAVDGLGGEAAGRAAEAIRELTSSAGAQLPTSVLEALAEIGPDPVLVLDDLHEIEAPEVAALVEGLVQAPAAPRVAIMTREDPPFAAGRLRVSGALLELRATDLRFTHEETQRLFDTLLPDVLDPALIQKLEDRTEGWPAGLRLAAIALTDADDPAALAENFAGTHRFVMEYLLEEALGHQTPALQRFLMETSVLTRFSRASCEEITGDPDAASHLATIRQAGLFLVPLGSDDEWYRYHRLFADLLQFRLASRQPERLEELHSRASDWFEREGDLSRALEHAAAMRDQSRLLELLDGSVLGMLGRGEMGALRYWMDKVRSSASIQHPMVLCLKGWLRVVTDRAPDLGAILRDIRAALERAPSDYPADRRRQAEVHTDVLSAYAARYDRRYEEALRIAESVQPRLDHGDPMTRGLLTYNTARVRMALAQTREAEGLLEQAFDDHLRSENLYLTLATLGRRAAVIAQTEGVQPARDAIDTAMAFVRERRLEKHPALSIVLYNRGFIELLAWRVDEAERWFQEAVDLATSEDYPEERVNALVGLTRAAQARGALDDAESFLREATALGQDRNADLGDSTLDLERARLTMARARAAEGSPLPDVGAPDEPRRWTAIRETEVSLAIQQALRAGDRDRAALLVDELERESELRQRGPALCTARLARARVIDPPDSWRKLQDALCHAAPRGYVAPFLEGGEEVRELLEAAEPRITDPSALEHLRHLLDRSGAPSPLTDGSSASPLDDPLGGLLTDRELEILACLFQGLSNKGIARSSFVSVETVKTHLKHVYAKLGVTSRTRAVAKARELGFNPEPASGPPATGVSP